MSTASRHAAEAIYFPLNQGERAKQLNVNQLLPQEVYARLIVLLNESLQQLEGAKKNDDGSSDFSHVRGHAAVFLDGDRGTGKTTVIVNLADYLASQRDHSELAKQIHVLQPIDSSQLEDDDDLFLNVVVAAVLGDEKVQEARDLYPERWRIFSATFQRLGIALEGKETQTDGVGLDRLRSFMGASKLAEDVHQLFSDAAALIGKKLLVLPIDDVDTTLHRAFETLEVVRRYLGTSVLIPVVCGDLRLYREVIWRDALGRLLRNSNSYRSEARPTAEALAVEYLRKIFPLDRRLRMPEIGELLANKNIFLGLPAAGSAPRLTFPHLTAWLRALLAGPVNEHENSRLSIPIPTLRALSQLISRVRAEIPALENAFFNESAPQPLSDLLRRIVYTRGGELPKPRRRGDTISAPSKDFNYLSIDKWQSALLDHFMFEVGGGPVCLVLLAAKHWKVSPGTSVFATPLFSPHKQAGLHEIKYNEGYAKLNWRAELDGRLPQSWVNALPNSAILPFATPEFGRAVVPDQWGEAAQSLSSDDDEFPNMSNFFLELITHRNFYSPNQRATLICSGRILELITTSLVRDVTTNDIERILVLAPFHSAVSLAPTKSMQISFDESEWLESMQEDVTEGDEEELVEEDLFQSNVDDTDNVDLQRLETISVLAKEINNWRRDRNVARLPLTPWLIYCATNKALNQAPFHTRPLQIGQQPSKEKLADVFASGLAVCNSFWAAIASFEKGPIFGLPLEVSNVNLLNRHGDFNYTPLYLQNILPLLNEGMATVHGEEVRSVTHALVDHPLQQYLRLFYLRAKSQELSNSLEVKKEPSESGRIFLLRRLGLSEDVGRITVPLLKRALKSETPKGNSVKRYGQVLYKQIKEKFGAFRELSTLRRAIDELEGTSGSERR